MNRPTISKKEKFLATICRFCPFCIIARRYPDSRYAKALKAAEVNCPACRAYDKIYRDKKNHNRGNL